MVKHVPSMLETFLFKSYNYKKINKKQGQRQAAIAHHINNQWAWRQHRGTEMGVGVKSSRPFLAHSKFEAIISSMKPCFIAQTNKK